MLIYQIAHSQKSKKEEKASFGCSLIHIHLFFYLFYFTLHTLSHSNIHPKIIVHLGFLKKNKTH